MKIEQFIEEFNKSQSKETYVKKHVINTYVPFENKIALANNIVKKTMFADNGDLVRNTPAIYMNYILALIKLYTDIEINDNETLSAFNLIEQYEVNPLLISAIGADAGSLDTVIRMVINDTIDNHSDLVNFMTIKEDNLKLLLDKAEAALKSLPQKS